MTTHSVFGFATDSFVVVKKQSKETRLEVSSRRAQPDATPDSEERQQQQQQLLLAHRRVERDLQDKVAALQLLEKQLLVLLIEETGL